METEKVSKVAETQQLSIFAVSNHALWRIEPYFDGINTAVTTYNVVDQNGTLQYMGDRNQCEYFLLHGCECSRLRNVALLSRFKIYRQGLSITKVEDKSDYLGSTSVETRSPSHRFSVGG
jgi:hypothetical protein